MSNKRPARRVLLIGWDAADWHMIEPFMASGHMPNMRRFVDEGCSGNIASLQPMLSPMLWTSIASGKTADKHQILGFTEPDGTTGRTRPVSSTSRACLAVWNILSRRGLKAGAVNWFASHPCEQINGFVVTDRFAHPVGPVNEPWPVPACSVHPAELQEELGALRVHPAQVTLDEVRAFVPQVAGLDPADPKILELRSLLAQCGSVHAAATALIQEFDDTDFVGVYYDTIDRFAHAFMEFHPPRMEHASEEEFERYSGVMRACYQFHDMMLGRLMNLVGEDTTVIIVSDHGFHCGHVRPEGTSAIKNGQPVAWHRPYGVVAAWGPGIKRGEKIYGASLLDITPTILTMLGVPVGEDMDGRAVVQIFEDPPEVATVASHEDGQPHDAETSDEEDPWVAQRMVEQLRQLGYVGEDNTEEIVLDRLRNLGLVYQSTGRPALAIEQYQEALSRREDDIGTKLAVCSCMLGLGELDRCEVTARELLQTAAEMRARLLLAMVAFRRGDTDRALEQLEEIHREDPEKSGLHSQLGEVYLHRGMLEKAECAFERAIEIDPDNAEAFGGLGMVYFRTDRMQDAVLAHTRSIALIHHQPLAHLRLGRALLACGRIAWAVEALHVAISMRPGMQEAHRLLGEVYVRAIKDPAKARYHHELAKGSDSVGSGENRTE